MFKEKVAEVIAKKTGVKKEDVLRSLEIPPNLEFGDLSFPCFSLASKLKKNPFEISKDLSKLDFGKEIEKTEARGPYLNFFVNKKILAENVLNNILKKKDNYGKNDSGKGKKVMIEFSQPNPNKPMHLGHLKNDSIGMAVSNILEFSGYKVIGANLWNDKGVPISKVMYAYKNLNKKKNPDKKPDHFVGDLYILYAKKENEKTEKEVLNILNRWEKKDKKTRELWKKIVGWAIKGIKETHKTFGTRFDVEFRESQFYNKAKDIIKDGLKRKVFAKKDNAIIAKLDPLPDKVILRSDGTSVYITNDLALTKHKFEKYKIDESIWVTGSEQKLYFEQLFRILFLLGYNFSQKCRHLSYGMVLLESGKMKSREGNVVDADDIIAEVKELAKKEIEKREKIGKLELEKRALAVSLSAIKFYLLRIDSSKDVLFEPEKAVSFEGYTGPYMQYAYARASNILKKSGKKNAADYSLLKSNEEISLINKLSLFEKVVKESAIKLEPNLIANYAYHLCQNFAEFYEKCPVMNAQNEKEKSARIALVEAFRQVLGNSLKLLGIERLERM